MDDSDIITVEFDDGEEVDCEIVGIFGLDEKEYIALIPQDGSGDLMIFGYKETEDDDFELLPIDDEAEFEAACREFDELMGDTGEE